MPRQFGRFCSGSLAGPAEGFDRYIYFANEETGAAESFDGLGGLADAIFDNVGKKDKRADASFLRRNGLDNGELYVLVPADPAEASEAEVTDGSIAVKWELIPDAGNLTDAQLETASDEVSAFRFARPEDGAFNKRDENEFFFVTTGDAPVPANRLGRLYSLLVSVRAGRPIRARSHFRGSSPRVHHSVTHPGAARP